MIGNLKALILVLAVALPVFWLFRPICQRFTSPQTFVRRRNVWIALTIAAFASPTVMVFLLIAAPVMVLAARKDSNIPALFAALMFVAPEFKYVIPQVFVVTPMLVLCCCIALPGVLRRTAGSAATVRSRSEHGQSLSSLDLLLISFFVLQIVLQYPYTTITNLARTGVVSLVVSLVPYFLVTRKLRDQKDISETVAYFTLSCAIMAAVAVVESARSWQLYGSLAQFWGVTPNEFGFLFRGGRVRAMAATGHSLALGFYLAVAFVFCLYFRRFPELKRAGTIGIVLMWGGLIASYARSPWFAAVLMMMLYFWLQPGGFGRVFKISMGLGMVMLVLLPTSIGKGIVDSLPFVGTLDSGSVDHRQKLLDVSLDLIPLHPWFGDLTVISKMESLRQGQGIIDIVNGFLLIALYYGLVTLAAWVLYMLITMTRTWRASLASSLSARDTSAMGSALVAMLAGVLFTTWTSGMPQGMEFLTALAVVWATVSNNKRGTSGIDLT